MTTPRLTQEQAAMLDADAFDKIAAMPDIAEFFRGEDRPGLRCDTGNLNAWRCRVLDLLDERTALVARAEQAEADRDALAAEVRAWRAFDEECKSRSGIIYAVHPTDISRATDAAQALSRSKEKP